MSKKVIKKNISSEPDKLKGVKPSSRLHYIEDMVMSKVIKSYADKLMKDIDRL